MLRQFRTSSLILLLFSFIPALAAAPVVAQSDAVENPPCIIRLFDDTQDAYYSSLITDGIDLLVQRTLIVEETQEFFHYDFFTDQLTPLVDVIPTTAYSLQLDAGRIVWLDDGKLFIHHLKTGQLTPPAPDAPTIAGNYRIVGTRVAWIQDDAADTGLFIYDFVSGHHRKLTDHLAYDGLNSFNGFYMVWSYNDGVDTEIFLYDVAAAVTRQLTDNDVEDGLVGLSGNTVVWTRDKQIVVYNAAAQTAIEFRGDSQRYGEAEAYPYIVFSGRYLLLTAEQAEHVWLLFYDVATSQLSEWWTENAELGEYGGALLLPQVAGEYGLMQRRTGSGGDTTFLYHIPTDRARIAKAGGHLWLIPTGIISHAGYYGPIHFTDNQSGSVMRLTNEEGEFYLSNVTDSSVLWSRTNYDLERLGLGFALCSGTPTRELLINGSFKDNDDATPTLPDAWIADEMASGGRLGTDLPGAFVSYSVPNALVFKGISGKKAALRQTVDLSYEVFNTGETLTFGAMVDQKSGVPGALVGKAIVKYAGGGKTVLKLRLPNPKVKGYTPISDQITLTSTDIASIKVALFYNAAVGKFFMDDVRLTRTPSDVMPLPSAPQ